MKKRGKPTARFAVCIKNKGYEALLEIGKLYRVVPDQEAEGHGYLRIVDESGDDYGCAADRFFSIEVPSRRRGPSSRRRHDGSPNGRL